MRRTYLRQKGLSQCHALLELLGSPPPLVDLIAHDLLERLAGLSSSANDQIRTAQHLYRPELVAEMMHVDRRRPDVRHESLAIRRLARLLMRERRRSGQERVDELAIRQEHRLKEPSQ